MNKIAKRESVNAGKLVKVHKKRHTAKTYRKGATNKVDKQSLAGLRVPSVAPNLIEGFPKISPFRCIQPAFKNQRILRGSGVTPLDENNRIAVQQNLLSEIEVEAFLDGASHIARISGKSAFNSMKPRKEVCYSADGNPYSYSGIKHLTRPMSLRLCQRFKSVSVRPSLNRFLNAFLPV